MDDAATIPLSFSEIVEHRRYCDTTAVIMNERRMSGNSVEIDVTRHYVDNNDDGNFRAVVD